jgi:uncharacterized protein (TIRG00374 family)
MAAIYKRAAWLLGQWWVKAIFTAALIGLIVAWVGPRRILGSLLASDPSLVMLSLVFTPAVIGLKTLRWQLLVGRRANFSYVAALRSYLAGLVLATVTPVAAGEVGRGLFVRHGNRAELTGKVVIDKLTDLVSLTGFAGVGLLLSGSPPARTAGLVLLIGVVLAAALSLLARRVAQEQGNAGWRRWPWLERFRISGILDGMATIRPAQLGVNVCLSLLGFVVYYSQALVMLKAFWPTASWEVMPYFPIITLSTILPIGIGGVGVREWTAVLLLRQFAVPEAVAFNTFFAHFIVVQVLPSLVGAYVIATFRPMPTENAA